MPMGFHHFLYFPLYLGIMLGLSLLMIERYYLKQWGDIQTLETLGVEKNRRPYHRFEIFSQSCLQPEALNPYPCLPPGWKAIQETGIFSPTHLTPHLQFAPWLRFLLPPKLAEELTMWVGSLGNLQNTKVRFSNKILRSFSVVIDPRPGLILFSRKPLI